MSIENIRSLIAQDMGAVDEVIREKLHSHVALIRQVSEYIINSGGKRLRPSLVLLSAGAFGYSGKRHHDLAAVIEFIHTATLLHDDVVDASELRRSKATANALFGNAASVLVGDFLYSRAFQMMVEVDNMRVMQVLADATNTIAEGEVLQLLNCRDPDVDEENYLRVIRYKTAKLFEAATRLGAILGGSSPAEEEAMAAYGMHLGTAFQLTDDILDYSGDYQDTGKNLGDDLAEGKPTLPLIYAIKNGSSEQAAIIRRAIEKSGDGGFQPVLEVIQQTGALDYARQRAQDESNIASATIASLPNSEYKECLLQLAVFAVTRNH
ncbi:MAG: octaprenyl diphosphate synthase [Nitrosomonadaceae bacterium]|nr:octaprenyl diphosphate synthase [Nitrosospira sp.]MDW7598177.1 octaprenyl diphosphate synthase [Nitrosomonadaceae bacterium]MBI0409337.1 octaprenyl diphosphate synthase [Nitrosospira sp.]MBI0410031.1 octaprenyl diphosphate synthase [Nitrosospira sp.]MBI0411609.1 octaprenyl diphosphate synthase [Nitrosospira sp.]